MMAFLSEGGRRAISTRRSRSPAQGGHVGQISWNRNGSYDIGPAQVNSTWLPTLEKAGITKAELLNNGCLNIAVGAWILAQAMDGISPHDPAAFWRGVGNYNSRTPTLNQQYGVRVWTNIVRSSHQAE
jgi:hypothetical protein